MTRARGPLAVTTALAALVAVLVAGLASAGVGCGRRDAGDDAAIVDTALLAYLSEARALHHRADLAREAGDVEGAIGAMERLVSARRPHEGHGAPEVEEVLADAYARLAELRLERADLAGAGAAVAKGLEHAPDVTYFRGHLVEVQGLVEEARAAQLADAGRADEAARARAQAIQLLEDVVRIQDRVIQRALAARDGGTEPGR